MATVPSVQSLIQPIAQANSPFLANNGNPGTVYNMPNTGSYKPPMASAQNQWALNPVAPTTPFWEQPTVTGPVSGGRHFVVPPLTVAPVVVPPAVVPPIVTPPGVPSVGNSGTGGAGTVGHEVFDPTFTGDWFRDWQDTGLNRGWAAGSDNTSGNTAGDKLGNFLQLGLDNVVGEKASFAQFLDAITEPFLPGDFYDADVGKVNKPELIKGALNIIVPGLGSISQALASKIPDSWIGQSGLKGVLGKIKDFLNKGKIQEATDAILAEYRKSATLETGDGAEVAIGGDAIKGDNWSEWSANNPFNGTNWNTVRPIGTVEVGPVEDIGNTGGYAGGGLGWSSGLSGGGWGGGSAFGGNMFGGSGGCVCTYVKLRDYDTAADVKEGNTMEVSDPLSGEIASGVVSYSSTKLAECVRISTERGVVLDCSVTAPISDVAGNEVLAPALLGVAVPVVIDGEYAHDVVVSVEPLGIKEIQHISVEDSYFLAGNNSGRYLFHHNKIADGAGSGSGGTAPVNPFLFGTPVPLE